MGEYILITYVENSVGTNFEDVQNIATYDLKDESYAVERIKNLQNLGYMHGIVVRKYNANTGRVHELEPYLDGFAVKLRELVPAAEPRTQMEIQRG